MVATKGERGTLLKSGALAAVEGEEVLLWAGDTLEAGRRGYPRTYPARTLWDVLAVLALLGPAVFAAAVSALLLVHPAGWAIWLYDLSSHPLTVLILPGLLAVAAAALGMMPLRVVREADSLAVEFALHRRVVPLGEVLELAVLDSGLQSFLRMLYRTGTFPLGIAFRWFNGLPSSASVMFVLLTAHAQSYVFCLEDPVQFLVENQRPLDLSARYRTASNVRVREGESLESRRVGNVGKGHALRIKEQRGRRVLVQFEDGKTHGWMSYVNQLGGFLLAKEREGGHALSSPLPGTVGASMLTGSYGTAAIELGSLAAGDEGE